MRRFFEREFGLLGLPNRTMRSRLAFVSVLIGVLLAVPNAANAGVAATAKCLGIAATIVGTDGDDEIVGTSGRDIIAAGDGIDRVDGGDGDDVICGGPTPYRVDFEGLVVKSELFGGNGDDTVVGGDGFDNVYGDDGSDVLRGGAGPDYLVGDASFTDQQSADQLFGGHGPDQLTGEGGDDELRGGSGADDIGDSFGRNQVLGGRGDDVLRSGPSNDWLSGGDGHDVVSFGQVSTFEIDLCEPIVVDLRKDQVVTQGWGRDRLTSIEGAWTSRGEDVLIGDAGPNSFFVGSVTCIVDGQRVENHDRVYGGGGRDTLTFETYRTEGVGGGVINALLVDLRRGRAGLDSANGLVTITFSSIENVLGSLGPDTIYGDGHANKLTGGPDSIETDLIRGRGGDDRITGNLGNDELYGGTGGDWLWGLGGDDRLDGGSGQNTNDGGGGTDVCLRPAAGSLAIDCED